jgi:hypothetical protein
VLIPAEGALGGSAVVLLAEMLVAALSVVVLWRRHPDVAPSFVPLWKVAAATLVALGGLLVPGGPVATVAVALTAYAAVLLALGAVPAELWHALRAPLSARAGGRGDGA